jgi:hypothetical protein
MEQGIQTERSKYLNILFGFDYENYTLFARIFTAGGFPGVVLFRRLPDRFNRSQDST